MDVYNLEHGRSIHPSIQAYIDPIDPWIDMRSCIYSRYHVYQGTQHTALTRRRDRARCLLQFLPVVGGPSTPEGHVKAVTW